MTELFQCLGGGLSFKLSETRLGVENLALEVR